MGTSNATRSDRVRVFIEVVAVVVAVIAVVVSILSWVEARGASDDAEEANQIAEDANRSSGEFFYLTLVTDAVDDCRAAQDLENEAVLAQLQVKALADIDSGTFRMDSYGVEVATLLPPTCQARVSGIEPPLVVPQTPPPSTATSSPPGSAGDVSGPVLSGWGLQVAADATLEEAEVERSRASAPDLADRVEIVFRPGTASPWRTVLTGFDDQASAAGYEQQAESVWSGGGTSIPVNLTEWCPNSIRNGDYVDCA